MAMSETLGLKHNKIRPVIDIHSSQNNFGRQPCYMFVARGVTHTHNPIDWLRITAKNIYGTEIGLDMPCQNFL